MQPDLRIPAILRGLPAYPAIEPDRLIDSHPGVASIFAMAGLDPENPLGAWIQPGMRVLVKPNWVRHAAEEWSTVDSLLTHPSILRPVVESAARALRTPSGNYFGEIVIADAPLQSANFERMISQCGISPLLTHWRTQGIPVRLRDLRRIIADTDDSTGIVRSTRAAAGDPTGDTVVDIGEASRLEPLMQHDERFGVSNYDSDTTSSHHVPGIHRYRIANSLLDCDLVINLPKWKTHVKTGITGALKNFIGVNCDKAYLPHFRLGSPRQGGDEFPDSMAGVWIARLRPWFERVMPNEWIRSARRTLLASRQKSDSPLIFGGAWPGNDTLWRTIHDMVFIARWLGPNGAKLSSPRPILTLLDAIVAGEGDGPLRPEPAHLGCLLFGLDPGVIDVHAASLSGLPWQEIPLLAQLQDIEALRITSFDSRLPLPQTQLMLKPPSSWAGTLQSKETHYAAA
jgi:uncharacterized protein (DUF362 family)